MAGAGSVVEGWGDGKAGAVACAREGGRAARLEDVFGEVRRMMRRDYPEFCVRGLFGFTG